MSQLLQLNSHHGSIVVFHACGFMARLLTWMRIIAFSTNRRGDAMGLW